MKPSNTCSSSTPNFAVIARSAVFFAGMVASTLVVAPLILLARPLTFAIRYRIAQAWVRFNLWTLKVVCGLGYTVEGLDNIPAGGGVILAKHQSAWETIALQAIFPPMVFILKRELLRIPFWGWAMAALEPIAIDRSAKATALKQVLRDGEARLRAGRWVVIFPEGTRVALGEKGRYNASGGMLACRVGCPVVPVAHNAGEFWRRNAFYKFPGEIRVCIGPAIDANRLGAAEVNRMAEQWIETKMSDISSVRGEFRQTVPS